MNIEMIKEINKTYKEKTKAENHTNDRDLNIWSASHRALHWYQFVGTKADLDTFGEFTRRFERCKTELEELIGTGE